MIRQADILKIIITIPCYNEEKRLPVQELLAFAKNNAPVQFVFVNDGSTDNTRLVIDRLCQILPEKMSAIHLARNGGKAEAVRAGLLYSIKQDPDIIGFCDADLATPLSEINRLTDVMDQHPEVVLVTGARVKMLGRDIQRKGFRHYVGRVFATFFSIVLGLGVYDTQCGAKIFKPVDEVKEVLKDRFITKWLFDVEILARLLRIQRRDNGNPSIRVYEEPLQQWHHIEGSKISAKDFFRICAETYRIWYFYRKG